MTYLMKKNLPRYECLLEAAQLYPELDPTACEAFLHLLRTGNDMTHEVEAYFAKHNLTQGRFFVLMLLMDKYKQVPVARTPAELAEVSGVTRATMTGLIDTLEKDGLVTREPDPKDHRMVSVRITTKGESVLKDIVPGHLQTMSSLMRHLTDSERKILVTLLGKVIRAVDQNKNQNAELGDSHITS